MLVVHPGRPEHADGPERDAIRLVGCDDERALGEGLEPACSEPIETDCPWASTSRSKVTTT